MSPSQPRGVSLLEALITVGLLGLTMAITSGVMRGYSRSFQRLDTNTLEIQARKAVLHGIRAELMGAVDFNIPSTVGPSWSNNLEFSKVDLSVPDRLTVFPSDWSPYDLTSTAPTNNFLAEVRYQENAGTLQRGVQKAGAGSFRFSQVPPSELISLESRLNSDNTVEIRITIQTPKGPQSVTSKTMRRIP